jgi:hypothetical protein
MAVLTFSAKVEINEAAIKAKTTDKIKQVQAPLDAMVLADSNYFIPIKTHTLENSSIESTKIGSGEIKWVTPYARRQYYGVNFDHTKQLNPNACAKWFEAAKARWFEKWVRFINEQLKRS